MALSVDEGKERTSVVQHDAKRTSQERTREERIDQSDVVLSQKGTGETFQSLLQRRISRRGILKAGLAAGAMVVVNPLTGKSVVGTAVAESQGGGGSVKYAPIPPQPDDAQQVMITNGYSWAPLAKWGDPIRAGAPAYDPNNLSAWAQEQQIGYNCDYIGYHPLPYYDKLSRRGLLWINHEYTNGELMWADYESGNPTREQTDVELAAHGGSVLEVIRGEDGRLAIDMYSPYNRRITATTMMRVSGPAAGHDLLKTQDDPTGAWVIGTLNNCAGGFTPWGTVLTCEENFQGYFGNLDQMNPDDPRTEIHERYGIEGSTTSYGWEKHYGRYDVTNEPNEPFRFGWVVEIDPYDPESTPIKRTALGRFRHEGATFGYSPSGRVVFYSGDDQRFDYVYKYISDNAYDPLKRGMGQGLLDEGVLYVAKFNDDGSGEWLPLVYGENDLDESNGFTSQGDVLITTRLAADLLGATKMDRPEDIQQNPVTHKIYAAMTNNSQRTEEDVDAANPRPDNRSGQVIEIEEADGDAASTTFTWDIFLLCGDPSDESTYFAGFPKDQVSPIACPDNVNFDYEGNLWISTDGQPAPLGIADGLYAVPTEGSQRGYAAQFLSVVAGAECASFEFVHDHHNLVVSIQHPGEGGTVDEPIAAWPDGGPLVRPTVIQVWKNDGGRING